MKPIIKKNIYIYKLADKEIFFLGNAFIKDNYFKYKGYTIWQLDNSQIIALSHQDLNKPLPYRRIWIDYQKGINSHLVINTNLNTIVALSYEEIGKGILNYYFDEEKEIEFKSTNGKVYITTWAKAKELTPYYSFGSVKQRVIKKTNIEIRTYPILKLGTMLFYLEYDEDETIIVDASTRTNTVLIKDSVPARFFQGNKCKLSYMSGMSTKVWIKSGKMKILVNHS